MSSVQKATKERIRVLWRLPRQQPTIQTKTTTTTAASTHDPSTTLPTIKTTTFPSTVQNPAVTTFKHTAYVLKLEKEEEKAEARRIAAAGRRQKLKADKETPRTTGYMGTARPQIARGVVKDVFGGNARARLASALANEKEEEKEANAKVEKSSAKGAYHDTSVAKVSARPDKNAVTEAGGGGKRAVPGYMRETVASKAKTVGGKIGGPKKERAPMATKKIAKRKIAEVEEEEMEGGVEDMSIKRAKTSEIAKKIEVYDQEKEQATKEVTKKKRRMGRSDGLEAVVAAEETALGEKGDGANVRKRKHDRSEIEDESDGGIIVKRIRTRRHVEECNENKDTDEIDQTRTEKNVETEVRVQVTAKDDAKVGHKRKREDDDSSSEEELDWDRLEHKSARLKRTRIEKPNGRKNIESELSELNDKL